MEIKIVGSGCAKCIEIEKRVQGVAAAKGGNIAVQKKFGIKEWVLGWVISTPAIYVGGVLKSVGVIPTKETIAHWIDDAKTTVAKCGH